MKLVSIIVTTRNEERNIGRLLKSLRKQSYKNIEIIVVDNKSSDKTCEIAKKFTKKVFDKGPERSSQRNFGVQKSKGSYLLILDADMELTKDVISDCVNNTSQTNAKALVIPEKTVGKGFLQDIRRFEREMYMGDLSVELARFFDRGVFFEFGGYDVNLTGPEDYDLFFRVKKKYEIGRTKKYILHHEEGLTLKNLLRKKYYYAKNGANYAFKHPSLIRVQGTIILRPVYFKNWKKFLKDPITGFAFIFVRVLETLWAVAGYISAKGVGGFAQTLFLMFKHNG